MESRQLADANIEKAKYRRRIHQSVIQKLSVK